MLFKAKGLSNKGETGKNTQQTKYQAKKAGKKGKEVHKRGNKAKGNCHNCGKSGHFKANCPELKKNRTEEVRLINYVKGTERPKVVNGMQMASETEKKETASSMSF